MNKAEYLFSKLGCDAAIVLAPSNTYYLSGYESSNCQILLTEKGNYFFTDMRYAEEAARVLEGRFEVVVGGWDVIEKTVRSLGIKKLGWDDNVLYSVYKLIKDTFGDFELIPISDKIELIRQTKSEEELELMYKAQSVTDDAFTQILPFIKEGVTEIEIAARLEYIMLARGCELAFDSIVAFGTNGSSPHAHRSETVLKKGDFVTMDFGAKYKGYCSDMTRTVAFGDITNMQKNAYDAVLYANNLAISKIKVGMTGRQADAIARDYLATKGLDKYFTHSLGHSVGIDIHEMPSFSPKCESVIMPDTVMTVEPGVYIEGQFGLRIEDMVIVKKDCVIDMTQSDKNLIILK